MTRTTNLAVALVLLVAGTALGQAPLPGPVQPAGTVISPDGNWSPAIAPVQVPCTNGNDIGVWADADFLLGWVRGDPLPPLVTTSPPGTSRAAAGVLGQPSTTVLFGSSAVNTTTRLGAGAALGYWFDPARTFGIEGSFVGLESASTTFAASSNGTPILARPFSNAITGVPSSSLIAFPGAQSGSVSITDNSSTLLGGNVDMRGNAYSASWVRVDALLGYQYLHYSERLNAQTVVQPTAPPFVPGTTVAAADSIGTHNTFNGVDVGLRTEFYSGPWCLEVMGKVAAGSLSRGVTINGTQVVTVPGLAPVTSQGGLLALASNIGGQSNHVWTGVPQFGATLGWQVTQNIRLRAGYSVLWWPNVVRPGEQVDTFINPALIPPATQPAGIGSHPAATGLTSSLWVQMVSVGLEVRY